MASFSRELTKYLSNTFAWTLSNIIPLVLVLYLVYSQVDNDSRTTIVYRDSRGEVTKEIDMATQRSLEYTRFLSLLEQGQVQHITLMSNKIIHFVLQNGEICSTEMFGSAELLISSARAQNLEVHYQTIQPHPWEVIAHWAGTLFNFVIIALQFFVLLGLFLQLADYISGNVGGFNMEEVVPENINTGTATKPFPTLNDVIGMENTKDRLKELSHYISNKQDYVTSSGRSIPCTKGAILYGNPGVGKTFIIKAFANTIGAELIYIGGGSVNGIIVGQGAAKIKSAFNKAHSLASEGKQVIIFIDEADSIFVSRERTRQNFSSSDEIYTVNTLLTEIDKIGDSKIFVFAATNCRPELIDPAIVRPGRIDTHIEIGDMIYDERVKLIEHYCKEYDLILSDEMVYEAASLALGFSPSGMQQLLAYVASYKIRIGTKGSALTQEELWEAVLTQLLGSKNKYSEINSSYKRIVILHELGHAMANIKPGRGPQRTKVLFISMESRGNAGGLVYFGPTCTHTQDTEPISTASDRIIELLGGMVAEDVLVGHRSTGAQSDLSKCRSLLNFMLGSGVTPESKLLCRTPQELSQFENTSKLKEELMASCYNDTVDIIKENKEVMLKLADHLADKPFMTGDDFYKFLQDNGYRIHIDEVTRNITVDLPVRSLSPTHND